MPDYKKNARVALKYAVDTGKLKRLPCEVCGECVSEAHHENYSKPLEVQWLCKRHHVEAHRKIRGRIEKIKVEKVIDAEAVIAPLKCADILRKKHLTKSELPSYIAAMCDKQGTRRDFARLTLISPSLLSDMISGRRNPSDQFLAKIGLERVVSYRSIINTLPPPVPGL